MRLNKTAGTGVKPGVSVNLSHKSLCTVDTLVSEYFLDEGPRCNLLPWAAPFGMVMPGVFPSWFNPVPAMTARMVSLSLIA